MACSLCLSEKGGLKQINFTFLHTAWLKGPYTLDAQQAAFRVTQLERHSLDMYLLTVCMYELVVRFVVQTKPQLSRFLCRLLPPSTIHCHNPSRVCLLHVNRSETWPLTHQQHYCHRPVPHIHLIQPHNCNQSADSSKGASILIIEQ